MSIARILPLVMIAASLVACSGNLGGGQSTLPGTPQGTTGVQGVGQPAPTATPNSASNVATIGDSVAPQPLPAVLGWGGTIAFSKPIAPPSSTPNPKSTATAAPSSPATGNPVSIGITAAVVEPSDAPHFGSGHRSSSKHADASASAGLLYISLLATADVTLGEYPAFAIDVPREVAAKYHDRPFALAIYDPQTKAKSYRLDVAVRDLASPAPASTPVAVSTATSTALPTGGSTLPAALTPPPLGGAMDMGGLPPDRVAFLAAASSLTLKANRPVVFALYAAPAPSASPSPAASPSPSAAPSPPGTAGPMATPTSASSPTSRP